MDDLFSDAFVITADPAGGIPIEQIRCRAAVAVTRQEIADVFALAYNKAWWCEDDIYDFETGTPEYIKSCRIKAEWFAIENEMKDRIFEILRSEGVEIPEKGQIAVLTSFMESNGYRDGCGWWIRKSELEIYDNGRHCEK